MAHKTGFLATPDDQPIEGVYPDEELSAIEQGKERNKISGELSVSSKPKLDIGEDFAAEIKARQAKESAERTERRKKEQAAAAKAEAKRRKELQKLRAEHQELDEDKIRERIAEKTYRENLTKLYPDAKPHLDEIAEANWEESTEAQKANNRGKLGQVYDTNLSRTIMIAFVMQAPAILVIILGLFQRGPATFWLIALGLVPIFGSAFLLYRAADAAKHKQVPSDQFIQFSYATLIPGMAIRLLLIIICMAIPLTGQLVGAAAGAALGASIHYAFLNRYGIYVSLTNTIINTLLFIICFLVFAIATGMISTASGTGTTLIFLALGVVEFFLGDRAAMVLAYRSNH